ncbi:MAG: hypothetical protein E7077_10435 [Bacteroidales bacterium]|nr:hypothetical protein [Bacteroidales bacterium]MBP5703402.1 hypothetical protein [Paludibacteraceae bacterium]
MGNAKCKKHNRVQVVEV